MLRPLDPPEGVTDIALLDYEILIVLVCKVMHVEKVHTPIIHHLTPIVRADAQARLGCVQA